MLAAQNTFELPLARMAELLAKFISGLPPWLAVTTVVTLLLVAAVTWGGPRLLRALDNRRVTKKACERITSEEAALEALRITRPERQRRALPGRRDVGGRHRQGSPTDPPS